VLEVEERDGPLRCTGFEVDVVQYQEVVETLLEVPHILDVLDH
jgi:hypothetical protein